MSVIGYPLQFRAWVLPAIGLGLAGALATAAIGSGISPVVALIGMVGIVVTTAMFLSPTVALQVLVFSIPFERIGRLTDDADAVAVSINRILGVIALAVLMLHALLGRKKLRFGLPFYLYGGYTAVALLSNVWAYTPDETFRQGFAILGNLSFFFLMVNLVTDLKQAKLVIATWLLATMLAAAFSLVDYRFALTKQVEDNTMGLQSTRISSTVNDGSEVRSIGTNVRRLFGPTAHPTLFGLNNTMALPFFLWMVYWTRSKLNLLWLAGLALSVGCIILANTRGVIVATVLVLLYIMVRGLWRLNFSTIAVVVLLGAAAVPLIPDDVYERTFNLAMYTTARGDSLRVRFKFWAKSWEIVQENWWHGVGVGNQTLLLERLTDENTGYMTPLGLRASAHNEYIWVLAEVGVFGYLFFWSFVALVTWSSFRAAALYRRFGMLQERNLLVGSQSIMICVLIFAGQSEAFHYPLKAWWMLAAINGLLLQDARQRSAELALASPAPAVVQPGTAG